MIKHVFPIVMVAALAACGGGTEAGAVIEDTTSIPPTSEAPAVSTSPSPADSTMMQGTVVDSAAAVRGTDSDSATGTTQQ